MGFNTAVMRGVAGAREAEKEKEERNSESMRKRQMRDATFKNLEGRLRPPQS